MGTLRDPGTCRWHFTKWSINKKFISIILCGGSFKFLIIVLLSDWPVLGVFPSRTVLVSPIIFIGGRQESISLANGE